MRLANRWQMPVRELLARMNSEDISRMMAFDNIHVEESWQQTAQICAVIANAMGSGKRTFKVADFMPSRKARPKSDQQLRAAFQDINNKMQENPSLLLPH
jgi:hypothetical protein